jgi:hypothetical protein
MLLAVSLVVVSISIFITFVGTSALASSDFNDFTINTPPENTPPENAADGSGTNTSESLSLEGLAPQNEGDLSAACSLLPERC